MIPSTSQSMRWTATGATYGDGDDDGVAAGVLVVDGVGLALGEGVMEGQGTGMYGYPEKS